MSEQLHGTELPAGVEPRHRHTHKLSCHGLTMTKRSCSSLSFLSLAMRSDGTKAASHAPTGMRERKPGKPQPICSKPAQVAELAAMALTGRGTRLASQQRMMTTLQPLKLGG